MEYSSLKGMKDILSPESDNYLYLIKVCSSVAERYGFSFIETPILEETSLFKRSVGESSDIVGKEMYQFIDKGGNNICLRPEGTAGIVRSFIQQKFDKAGQKKNFFIMGQCLGMKNLKRGDLGNSVSLVLKVLEKIM